MVTLSRRTVEMLIDLVEIKLSCLEVLDRADEREQARLELARRELQALNPPRRAADILPFAKPHQHGATA